MRMENSDIKHGTQSAYVHDKCRCDPCKDVNTKVVNDWRKKHPERSKEIKNRSFNKKSVLVTEMKVESGCVDCGYNDHPDALEFDHVRGVKLFNIATGVNNQSWENILAEIEKCEVVCANCHRIRTSQRRKAKRDEKRVQNAKDPYSDPDKTLCPTCAAKDGYEKKEDD